LASALASTSRNWPRPRSSGLSLEVLALFNITDANYHESGRSRVKKIQESLGPSLAINYQNNTGTQCIALS